jgi:addiction module HigA family antidote
MAGTILGPVPPGEILKEEFLDRFGLSSYALAKELNVPTNRITGIVNGERAITAETLRLSRYFGTTPDFWMNLQTHYDLEVTSRKEAARIEKEVARRVAGGERNSERAA